MRRTRFSGGLMAVVSLCLVGAALALALVHVPAHSEPVAAGAFHVSRFAATAGPTSGEAGAQSPETVVAFALTATAAAGNPRGTSAPAPGDSASASAVPPVTGTVAAGVTVGMVPPAVTAPPTLIPDAAPLYAQVSPAVVMISNPLQRQPQSHAAGIASGTIYDPQGYIVTVGRVVVNPQGGALVAQVDVVFPNSTQVTGKVLGRDDVTDLAVVKIDPSAVPATATFGDSAHVATGQPVIAIGAPLEFASTVTRGIVSGTNRAVGERGGLIQTSVSASSGVHGGPLVDVYGNVVGILTFNLHNDNDTYRVAFAVPSNTVQRVILMLAQDGKVARPDLGATTEILTPARAVALGIGVHAGAYVDAVVKDGPADKAGLLPGDVITAVNSTAITEANPLNDLVPALVAQQSAMLTVNRGGVMKQLSLTPGDSTAP